MSNIKKGFVFYFDWYSILLPFSMEQKGMIHSVLVLYADRVWRDPAVSMEDLMDTFPKLSPEARVACAFIGQVILRDTQTWLSKREYRQKKRQETDTGRPAADRQAREDMERTRRLMEQLKEH